MAHPTPPPDGTTRHPSGDNSADLTASDVELLRVLVSRNGTKVDAQWAIHPRLKHDLLPGEWKEVTDLMAKVTDIVGHRFSAVLASAGPITSGHA